MRIIGSFLFLLAFCVASVSVVSAQETEERVVDEVVAVVNEGVITLSKVKREAKGVVEAGVQQGKTREAAQREVDEKQGEMIANLIHEELLMQKAKELGFESEIEALFADQAKVTADLFATRFALPPEGAPLAARRPATAHPQYGPDSSIRRRSIRF